MPRLTRRRPLLGRRNKPKWAAGSYYVLKRIEPGFEKSGLKPGQIVRATALRVTSSGRLLKSHQGDALIEGSRIFVEIPGKPKSGWMAPKRDLEPTSRSPRPHRAP